MDGKICGTSITGEYVAKHIKNALGPHAILASYEAKRIAVDQGFVSHILHMKLQWAKEQDDLPKTVVVKVPVVETLHNLIKPSNTIGNENEKSKSMISQVVITVHKAECDFYQMLEKTSPIAMPKFYLALPVTDDEPGMIILEDLSEKAATSLSLVEGLTLPQTLAAVTEIARLHAWSLTTTIDWRSRIPKSEDQEQLMRCFLEPLAQGFKKSKKDYPDKFGSIDPEKLASLVTYEKFAAMFNEHREFIDDVLVHGDFHMNNILFEKNNDGSVSERLAALIDFQSVVSGNPAFDVARLFCFSVSHKLRRQYETEIFQRYYDEVKSIAGDKFQIDFEQFRLLYNRQFALGAVRIVGSIPIMTTILVKSEGEQKTKDENDVVTNIKANYDDAAMILEL